VEWENTAALARREVELRRIDTRRRPGLERGIIFVTGDTLNPLTKRFLDRTGAPSLSKPFGLDAVRRLVPQHASVLSANDAEVALRA
jgi:hypothetical protein